MWNPSYICPIMSMLKAALLCDRVDEGGGVVLLGGVGVDVAV